VLNSERAAQTRVQGVRAFVRLRQMPASNAELARKREALEKKFPFPRVAAKDAQGGEQSTRVSAGRWPYPRVHNLHRPPARQSVAA